MKTNIPAISELNEVELNVVTGGFGNLALSVLKGAYVALATTPGQEENAIKAAVLLSGQPRPK